MISLINISESFRGLFCYLEILNKSFPFLNFIKLDKSFSILNFIECNESFSILNFIKLDESFELHNIILSAYESFILFNINRHY